MRSAARRAFSAATSSGSPCSDAAGAVPPPQCCDAAGAPAHRRRARPRLKLWQVEADGVKHEASGVLGA
jgi:hypothetical protein